MPGLLLLRHAQSVWNADGRWQGWADPALSREGERQTRQAANRLAGESFHLVVSSALIRARRTAELLAGTLDLSAPHSIEPDLREYDVGEWTGCTLEQIESRWPGAVARFGRGEISAPPGGENRDAFDARVVAAGRRVAAAAEAMGAVRILIVAHGGVLRALARAAGQAECRVGHLAGYWGSHAPAGLFPAQPVNLLDDDIVADVGEAAIASAV